MIQFLLEHPTAIALGSVAAIAIVTVVVWLVARRAWRENRYDRARDGASSRVDALAQTLSYADVTMSRTECCEAHARAMSDAKTTFARLAARKDLFLEQGATVGEWNGLAAEAGRCLADLHTSWDSAREQVWSAKLARQATAAAEAKLASYNAPDGARLDVGKLTEQLDAARRFLDNKQYAECRAACKAIDPLIAVNEESAEVKRLLAEAEGCTSCGNRKAIDNARREARKAFDELEKQGDADGALKKLRALRTQLEKFVARPGKG